MPNSPESYPFAIVLCRYKEYEGTIPAEPADYFENLFLGQGVGSINEYWRDISRNNLNLNGSEVFGWHYLPHTRAEEQQLGTAKANADPNFHWRYWQIENAIDLAVSKGIDLSKFYGIVAIYEFPGDTGGVGKGAFPVTINGKTFPLARVILDQPPLDENGNPGAFGWRSPTITAHEIGHALGFEHSFRFLGYNNPSHKMYGDPWDIMSADGVYKFKSQLGLNGPGLNSAYLISHGWLESDEIWEPKDGVGDVTLLPLYPTNSPGIRVARIPDVSHLVPIDGPGDYGWPLYLASGFYTVEYRSGGSWDSGLEDAGNKFADDVVLIHWGSHLPGWRDRSVLMQGSENKWGLRAGDYFIDKESNIRIDVVEIEDNKQAKIKVGPTPSITLDQFMQNETAQIIEEITFTWPGVPGYCAPKTFKANSVHQKQKATVSTLTMGLVSPVKLLVNIGKISLNKSGGTLALTVDTKVPHIKSDPGSMYKSVKKQVELTFSRQGNQIMLYNRPEDGNYIFNLTVRAVDAVGVEVVSTAIISFNGWQLEFDEGFKAYSAGCLQSAIVDHIKSTLRRVPVEQKRFPSPVDDHIAKELRDNNYLINPHLSNTLETLRNTAEVVYGPLFEETAQLDRSISWINLGWRPQRTEFIDPERR